VIDVGPARLVMIVSPAVSTRQALAVEIADAWTRARAGSAVVSAPPAAAWPFTYPLHLQLPSTPTVVLMADVHDAFVNHQTASTHLVTTQSSYLMQAWLDATSDREVLLLATADRATLAKHAPDVLARRGPFADARIEEIDHACPGEQAATETIFAAPAQTLLAKAIRVNDPAERLALCVQALDCGRNPAALVAAASVCMEVNDLEAAARDLDEALTQAPEWAAAHFERGKLQLRVDDMEGASQSFREATTRMPRFGAAWANLGATLGELDRTNEALAAFEQALQCDPNSPQALNNIGVVNRELGNLAASEAAFRRVVGLVPELAFGHYNLGHALFLQGRYQAALSAYVAGQQRDPERNPVQAGRLALCRLAAGDARGALVDLERATTGLPREYRHQLLADANTIAWALFTHRPDLPGWKDVHDWLTRQLASSGGRVKTDD
jgi:tetratricopeptide (TPR) repeat protein